MNEKIGLRRELVQWVLAASICVGGLVLFHLSSASRLQAQERQYDPMVEGECTSP